MLKPASLSPLPLPLAYTNDTLRPTHHRTTTSHSQPTPTSSETSGSNNTQRSASQPRDTLPHSPGASIRTTSQQAHTTPVAVHRQRQRLRYAAAGRSLPLEKSQAYAKCSKAPVVQTYDTINC